MFKIITEKKYRCMILQGPTNLIEVLTVITFFGEIHVIDLYPL